MDSVSVERLALLLAHTRGLDPEARRNALTKLDASENELASVASTIAPQLAENPSVLDRFATVFRAHWREVERQRNEQDETSEATKAPVAPRPALPFRPASGASAPEPLPVAEASGFTLPMAVPALVAARSFGAWSVDDYARYVRLRRVDRDAARRQFGLAGETDEEQLVLHFNRLFHEMPSLRDVWRTLVSLYGQEQH